MKMLESREAVYTYADTLVIDKFCNKYSSILYLCDFSHRKRKIM